MKIFIFEILVRKLVLWNWRTS